MVVVATRTSPVLTEAVKGVKTIMVNEALRPGGCRVASASGAC